MFGSLKLGPTRRVGSPEDQYWNLRFICNLVLEIWGFGMQIKKYEIVFESSSTSKR